MGSLGSESVKPFDVKTDAQRVFEVLQGGGLAIVPSHIGYGLVATDPVALEKAFTTKQRAPHKRHAMMGSFALHKEIHVLPPREAGMVELLTQDCDLTLGVVAPYRPDHPFIKKLTEGALARSSFDGTIGMLLNGGPLQEELVRLSMKAGVPLMGSSANLTGKGTKSRLEDVEPEILAVADIVIDYGKRKHTYPRASSNMIDFRTMKLLRYGASFDVLQDVMRKFYGIEFPDDPGRDTLFSGHITEPTKGE